MKNVAGFHSLDFGFFLPSLERRKGFGMRLVQKPVSATVGGWRALFARIWHTRGARAVARVRVAAERASSLLVAILSILLASTIRSNALLETACAHGKNQSSAPPAVFFPMFGMEGYVPRQLWLPLTTTDIYPACKGPTYHRSSGPRQMHGASRRQAHRFPQFVQQQRLAFFFFLVWPPLTHVLHVHFDAVSICLGDSIQPPHDITHHQSRRREGGGFIDHDLYIGNNGYPTRTPHPRVRPCISYEYRDEEDHDETRAGQVERADGREGRGGRRIIREGERDIGDACY